MPDWNWLEFKKKVPKPLLFKWKGETTEVHTVKPALAWDDPDADVLGMVLKHADMLRYGKCPVHEDGYHVWDPCYRLTHDEALTEAHWERVPGKVMCNCGTHKILKTEDPESAVWDD